MTLALLTVSVFCTDAVTQVSGTPDQSVLYLAMIYSTPVGALLSWPDSQVKNRVLEGL
jgi:hypothetical protein